MKASEASRKYADAQFEMITALNTVVTEQSKRIDSLKIVVEALSRLVEARGEVLDALRESYDEKFTLISERLIAMAADRNE